MEVTGIDIDSRLADAFICLEESNPQGALDICERVRAEHPDDPDARAAHIIAQIFVYSHDPRLVGDLLEEAKQGIEVHPFNLLLQRAYGLACLVAGDPLTAEDVLRTCTARDDQDALTWAWLSQAQALLEKPAEAVVSAERGLALRPATASLHLHYIAKLYEANRLADAAEAAEAALSQCAPSADLYNALAGIRIRQKRTSEAADAYRKALELDPYNEVAKDGLRAALMHRLTPYRNVILWLEKPQNRRRLVYVPLILIFLMAVSWAVHLAPGYQIVGGGFAILFYSVVAVFGLGHQVLMASLFFQRDGRRLMTKIERYEVMLSLALAAMALICCIGIGFDSDAGVMAVLCVIMMFVIGGGATIKTVVWPRYLIATIALVIGLAGFAAFIFS